MWFNWSVFPTVDEGELYAQTTREGVHRLFGDVIERTNARGAEMQAHLAAARDQLVYGWGDYRKSTTFGLASRRLIESVGLRRRLVTEVHPDP